MLGKIPFVKMHGLGNDFVIIDKNNIRTGIEFASLAKSVSDRRLGIGADQFIIYQLDEKMVNMSIFNHDGSAAKACGNASRCLVRLMHDKFQLNQFTLKIGDRALEGNFIADGQYAVNMGQVDFAANWMPGSAELLGLAAKYGLGPKEIICADVGNPHIVIFSKLSDQDKKIIGKDLQHSPLFPDGINVNFATVTGDVINLKVYERGTGFTLACGSGACASYASSRKLGHSLGDSEVHFKLGKLMMKMIDDQVVMCGPAEYIFAGEYFYG